VSPALDVPERDGSRTAITWPWITLPEPVFEAGWQDCDVSTVSPGFTVRKAREGDLLAVPGVHVRRDAHGRAPSRSRAFDPLLR